MSGSNAMSITNVYTESAPQCIITWYIILISFLLHVLSQLVCILDQELLILAEHPNVSPVFSGVRVAWSLVFCAVLCRSLFVHFLWQYCCLSFLDLRILIIPLVSSNSSYDNSIIHTFVKADVLSVLICVLYLGEGDYS